ncbi:hypothetical protein RRF57_011591 [Xylaria bambusicola]|uniref:Uncharacterized protein n=1 Tax=Xylaria bambusicola TaxID=326684 RepID=A0AAN7V2Y0_9PEZI
MIRVTNPFRLVHGYLFDPLTRALESRRARTVRNKDMSAASGAETLDGFDSGSTGGRFEDCAQGKVDGQLRRVYTAAFDGI